MTESEAKPRFKRPDFPLLAATAVACAYGLAMVYSASAIWADQHLDDPAHYLKRQLLWLVIGWGGLFYFSRLNYNALKEWTKWAVFFCWLTLFAVLFASPIAGAKRWIRLAGFSFQPAEFAKLAMILFLADYLDRRRSKLGSALRGMVIPLGVLAVTFLLISLEPDLGTPVLIFGVGLLLLFIGGVPLRSLAGLCVAATPLVAFEILRHPYRLKRISTFLTPWADPQGAGYQLVQSFLAVGSGGVLGKGLGQSQLKLLYLPTPHTDFIFPVICEELGLLGGLSVLALFGFFLARGVRIARAAPNLFGLLLASGITFLITFQALLNMMVSLGLLPTKGLSLPFFSFGGSSIVVTLAGVGILLNISKQAEVKI